MFSQIYSSFGFISVLSDIISLVSLQFCSSPYCTDCKAKAQKLVREAQGLLGEWCAGWREQWKEKVWTTYTSIPLINALVLENMFLGMNSPLSVFFLFPQRSNNTLFSVQTTMGRKLFSFALASDNSQEVRSPGCCAFFVETSLECLRDNWDQKLYVYLRVFIFLAPPPSKKKNDKRVSL